MYSKQRSRDQIIRGSTTDAMKVLYVRNQRASINDPANLNDLPPEVTQKALIYLLPTTSSSGLGDLVSACLVNRALYPVAQELLLFRLRLGYEKEISGRVFSHLRLRSIVGLGYSIRVLDLGILII
jgi:hypothetical protein